MASRTWGAWAVRVLAISAWLTVLIRDSTTVTSEIPTPDPTLRTRLNIDVASPR
nr:hypothetical protein [Pseudosulfitobacter pseudonitzschiae]